MTFLTPYLDSLTLEQTITFIAVGMWFKGVLVGLLLENWLGIVGGIKRVYKRY
jgi:hypothetical protein